MNVTESASSSVDVSRDSWFAQVLENLREKSRAKDVNGKANAEKRIMKKSYRKTKFSAKSEGMRFAEEAGGNRGLPVRCSTSRFQDLNSRHGGNLSPVREEQHIIVCESGAEKTRNSAVFTGEKIFSEEKLYVEVESNPPSKTHGKRVRGGAEVQRDGGVSRFSNRNSIDYNENVWVARKNMGRSRYEMENKITDAVRVGAHSATSFARNFESSFETVEEEKAAWFPVDDLLTAVAWRYALDWDWFVSGWENYAQSSLSDFLPSSQFEESRGWWRERGSFLSMEEHIPEIGFKIAGFRDSVGGGGFFR